MSYKSKKLYKRYRTLINEIKKISTESGRKKIEVTPYQVFLSFPQWGGLNLFSISQYHHKQKKILFFKKNIPGIKIQWDFTDDADGSKIEKTWYFSTETNSQETMFYIVHQYIQEELNT